MTYRHTKFNGFLTMLIFAWAFPASQSLASCKFDETPLINEKACPRFKASDTKLNKTYKELIPKLDSNSKSVLRLTQREWIAWRDEKCDQVQEKTLCENSLCNGVAHDICIIDLTDQRTKELGEYFRDIEAAKMKSFAFSKKYK